MGLSQGFRTSAVFETMFFVPLVIFCQVLGCCDLGLNADCFVAVCGDQSLGMCQPLVGASLTRAVALGLEPAENGLRLGSFQPLSAECAVLDPVTSIATTKSNEFRGNLTA